MGRASCVPDQVSVGLGVEVTTQTVGQSLRDAATAVQQLLEVLDAAGPAGRDRQTSGLSVSPGWDPRTERQSGHTASYQLRLVVRDLDSAGRLVERASEAVGDRLRVHGFELSVADPLPQQEQARRAAVNSCRRQAEQLADAAGAVLGDLLGLEEGGRGEQVDRLVWLQGRKSRSAGTPIEAGELEVAVVVTGRWRLREAPHDE